MNLINLVFYSLIIFNSANVFGESSVKKKAHNVKVEMEISRNSNDEEQALKIALQNLSKDPKYKNCKVKKESASIFMPKTASGNDIMNDKWNITFEASCTKFEENSINATGRNIPKEKVDTSPKGTTPAAATASQLK